MADNFASYATGLDSPGRKHFAITPHASNNEANNFRGIYVGVGGDVEIVAEDGTALVYKNAASGSVIPMGGRRVNAALTTATNLIGLY